MEEEKNTKSVLLAKMINSSIAVIDFKVAFARI
jgi:hypothetical protein